jgi:cytidine deaminase
MSIDWEQLKRAAVAAKANAYAPYSNFPVGAAAITTDGRVVRGCNVENASYGLTLCAECGLISDLFAQGGGKLAAFVCVDDSESPLVPCGRCRQLLFEHAAPGLQVLTKQGVRSIDELLPDAFGPDTLAGN